MTSLFEWKPAPAADGPRLGKQLASVLRLMTGPDQEWWTFAQLREAMLAEGIGVSEPGVSARIRDLRKAPINLKVDRMATGRRGVFAYRVRR